MSKIIGKISDAKTKETLPGANVVLTDIKGKQIKTNDGSPVGVSTNIDGKYEIDIPRNPVPLGAYLTTSFVGYEPKTIGIDWTPGNMNDVDLDESSTMLNEVVITAPKKEETIPAKVSMTLEQSPIQPPVQETKGWASFSKMKKGLIIGGASLGVVLLIIGITMATKKE